MKRNLSGLIGLILVFGFFSANNCQADEKLTVSDLMGRKVTFAGTPQRIICLSPGTLRLIVYLEAQNRVVGVEDIEKKFPETRPYWMANSELSRLPSIGPGGPNSINKEPDLEKVLAINPDVVFISYMSRKKADALQNKIGIPIVVINYGPLGSFDDSVYDSIRLLGRILDKNNRAQAVIRFFENSRKDLAARSAGVSADQKPAVYVGGIGFKGSHGIESTETRYAPLEWIKAKNIARIAGKNGHLFVGKETILGWNPDIIFIDSGGYGNIRQDFIKKPDFYKALKAFKNKRVYILHSFNWYMTNLGTVVADAYTAGKILYPERFHDVNLAEKADEIYTFLVGKPVYQQMVQSFGQLSEVPSILK